jgi:hypothetical protein
MRATSATPEDPVEVRRRIAKARRETAKDAHPFDRALSQPPDQDLFDDETESDAVLVAFAGGVDRLGVAPVDFFEHFRDWQLRRIFVRRLSPMTGTPHTLGATTHQVAESLHSIVAGHKRSVFTGTSSGGFYALLFGTLVGVDGVVGIYPITSMRREVLDDAGDARWDELLAETPETWIESFGDIPRFWETHPAPAVVAHYPYGTRVYAVQADHIADAPNVIRIPRREDDPRQALSNGQSIYHHITQMLWPGRVPPPRSVTQ